MDRSEVKEALKKYIDKHPGTTFVEIERVLAGCGYEHEGSTAVTHPGTNIVLWGGLARDAAGMVMNELRFEGYCMEPIPVEVYASQGKVLNLPLAPYIYDGDEIVFDMRGELPDRYVKPHWMPVAFYRKDECGEEEPFDA